MRAITSTLQLLLSVFAILQVAIAVLNIGLVRFLKWKDDLDQLPLLLRQVFMAHLWFISLTLAIFGVMTWRFSTEMAASSDRASVWLAGAIGLFWGVRVVLQIAYYSASHWRGQAGRTMIHAALVLVYGGMGSVYLLVAPRAW
jgi:hypothetical protein